MIDVQTDIPEILPLHRQWTDAEQIEFQNMANEYSSCNLGKLTVEQAMTASMQLMMIFDAALQLRYQVKKFDA